MIRLRFVREADIVSDTIAWFTQSIFSHVDCILPDGQALGSRSDRVGGKPSGVQIRPFDYHPFAVETTLGLQVLPEVERKFYQFLYSQVGKPYDHSAIWGFATGRYWRQEDSWICSELQAAALEYSGRIPSLVMATSKITPGELALMMSALQT
jgi:hypothetical protein